MDSEGTDYQMGTDELIGHLFHTHDARRLCRDRRAGGRSWNRKVLCQADGNEPRKHPRTRRCGRYESAAVMI
jgi:hypothetical protein